ncbi:hypothetical protein [Williamsia sp.]|uniref:hypothetical protein n=1 Tax=Williamsia sp. TaxID=1872085 RepID=UPI0025EF8F51|nr:hypothetical protein [Williamsia sp.]
MPIATPLGTGIEYYRRKITEGKTRREAQRCLKRQITKQIWRTVHRDGTTTPVRLENPAGDLVH